ncbi:MAG: c-type cytochrome [Fidelibacterota bacterium]
MIPNNSKRNPTRAGRRIASLSFGKLRTSLVLGAGISLLVGLGVAPSGQDKPLRQAQDRAPSREEFPSNPMAGRIVFEDKGCIDCHSIDGFGGTRAPDLGRDMFFGSFYDLASRLWNHAPQMAIKAEYLEKEWPIFSTDEMDRLVTYLFFLRYLGEPGNVSKGKTLLETKGCLTCHRVGDKGNPEGVALDQLQAYASPLYIAQVIWNHGPEMQKKMHELGIQRPTFDDQDITHISAYLREFSRTRPSRRQFMSPGNPQRGRELFVTKWCNHCHAARKDQPSTGTRLEDIDLHRSVTAIAGSMWNHGNTMWKAMQEEDIGWPTFEGSEMADLIAYLYFIDYRGSPGDPGMGSGVFREKACATCHATGELGPAPAEWSPGETSPTELVKTMWNHVPLMRELIVTSNIPWPELTADELRHLYAYLLHLRPDD